MPDSRPASPQTIDISTPLIQKLGELFSREEQKTLPLFKGKTTDPLVTDWLKKAEHVANNNNWDGNQKLRFFSNRLGGEAISWHTEYAIVKGPNLTYDLWKKDFISRFRNELDLEKLRHKLELLRQKPEQRTKAFVAKLDELYNCIHGAEPPTPDASATQECRDLFKHVKIMRNETKKRILMTGLLPKIKYELWPRVTPSDRYEEICELAYIAENIVIYKQLSEPNL